MKEEEFKVKDDSEFKFFDTEVKEFEAFECKKQEKPLSEDEETVLLAIMIKENQITDDEKKAKDDKHTMCVSMTPKTKKADKKEADKKHDKHDKLL